MCDALFAFHFMGARPWWALHFDVFDAVEAIELVEQRPVAGVLRIQRDGIGEIAQVRFLERLFGIELCKMELTELFQEQIQGDAVDVPLTGAALEIRDQRGHGFCQARALFERRDWQNAEQQPSRRVYGRDPFLALSTLTMVDQH